MKKKLKDTFLKLKPPSNRTDALVVCVLALDSTHMVVQVYLRPDDEEFIPAEQRRLRRCFAQEVFKTDLYSKIEIKQVEAELANCFVVGIRQFVLSEPSFETSSSSGIKRNNLSS